MTALIALAVLLAWLLVATVFAWVVSAAIDARDRAEDSALDTLASPGDAAWETLTPR